MTDTPESSRRAPWLEGAAPGAEGWLSLSDDELLYRIQALSPGHDMDEQLLEIVRSNRHFFIRQEAAKRVEDAERLKAWASDRHVGQVLVRGLARADDVAYLDRLQAESRHLEVRKAAEAQLALIRRRKP
jgi:hypothetical protein